MMKNIDTACMEELHDLINLMKSNGIGKFDGKSIDYIMSVLFEPDGEPSSEVHYDFLPVMEKAREIGIRPSDTGLLKRVYSRLNPGNDPLE